MITWKNMDTLASFAELQAAPKVCLACAMSGDNGAERVKNDPQIRREFIEEMGDVFMYCWDALMCLGVTPEEFSEIYAQKCAKNLGRDYIQEHIDKYGEDESSRKFWGK